MASIFCTSAMHLSTLHPHEPKYSDVVTRLMPPTIALFRQSLSRPATKNNYEAIVGVALLVNYMTWFDLSFLGGDAATSTALIRDPLLLLSSGVSQVWFQTIPVLIEGESVFRKAMTYHPRLIIEEALAKGSDDGEIFIQPLMNVWDDPRYQTPANQNIDQSVYEPPNNRAWNLLQGLERELLPANSRYRPTVGQCDREVQHYKEKVARITRDSNNPHEPLEIRGTTQARTSFEYLVRRVSPIIRCQDLLSSSDADTRRRIAAMCEEIEGFVYGFPILFCGPFTDLVQRHDTRYLVLLLHFYRSARILLDPERCWWAKTRSAVMEDLIVKEMDTRGLGTSLHDHALDESETQ